MNFMKIRHLLIALALASIAPFAVAAFQPAMTIAQAEAEVKLQRTAGVPLAQIIQNAQKAPLSASLITTALINAGFDPAEVVAAMLRAGAPLQIVVNAALAAGASSASVQQGAVAAGVSPTAAQAAIDASPTQVATSNELPPPIPPLGQAGGGGTCTAASVSPC